MGMRVTVAIAIVEAALVSLWITLFIRGGAIGSSHQHWYVEVPLLFLIVPATTTAFAIMIRKSGGEWRSGLYLLFIFLLAANLIAFCAYGVMSGGGV